MLIIRLKLLDVRLIPNATKMLEHQTIIAVPTLLLSNRPPENKQAFIDVSIKELQI